MDNDDDGVEFITYGCLPPEEKALMQCNTPDHVHAKLLSVKCCKNEDLCNEDLRPVLPSTAPPTTGKSFVWVNKKSSVCFCINTKWLASHLVKPVSFPRMCGSRKYPSPPWKTIGNSEGEGGFKGSNFWGVGGFCGKLLFQRVANHVQNIESNIRSIWSAKTYLRTLFWNKSHYPWPLR